MALWRNIGDKGSARSACALFILIVFTSPVRGAPPPLDIAALGTKLSGLEAAVEVMNLVNHPSTIHRAHNADSVSEMRRKAMMRIDRPSTDDRAISDNGRQLFSYLPHPNRMAPETVMMLLNDIGQRRFNHYPPEGFESLPVGDLLWTHIPYDAHGIQTASTIGEHTLRFMMNWQHCEDLGLLPYDAFYLLSPSILTRHLHNQDTIPPYFELVVRYHALTHDLTKYAAIEKNRMTDLAKGIRFPPPRSHGQHDGLSLAASDIAIQLVPLLNDQRWGEVPFGDLIKPYLVKDNAPVEFMSFKEQQVLEPSLSSRESTFALTPSSEVPIYRQNLRYGMVSFVEEKT